MKLVIDKDLQSNIYSVTIDADLFDETDLELFSDFGEPTIDIGGEIKDSSGTVLTTLPNAYRKIHTQFPVKMTFDERKYNGQAKDVANAWVENVQERYLTVMNALRLKLDDFTGTEEFLI